MRKGMLATVCIPMSSLVPKSLARAFGKSVLSAATHIKDIPHWRAKITDDVLKERLWYPFMRAYEQASGSRSVRK